MACGCGPRACRCSRDERQRPLSGTSRRIHDGTLIMPTRLRLCAPALLVDRTLRRVVVTRRTLQLSLGLIWLLDAGLQAQPFMFGKGFARDIIGPAGHGQPAGVAVPVQWAASLIGSHAVLF